ncbi:hypothetical protein FSP39_003321 [Pinctada imbricata]|uniref:CABIT domain-containing protein n=1 Tax=Pinctada imbricata TaxID=66713 RepID=A0AA89C0C7_PINIB|nr:hypothetical protein FSP39_003321 [Pinctada imbricata]
MALSVTDMGPLPDPVWDSNQILLKDVLMQCEIPTIGKIVKGQFMNLGVSKIPFKSLQQAILIHCIKTNVKVLAHSVTTKVDGRDGRTRLIALDQRLSIPLTYQGWFELLSEDGRSARPIDTVFSLAKYNPSRCLVRQNIQAFMTNSEGKLTFDKYKVVLAGEQLALAGDITVSSPMGDKIRLLRCTDTRGCNLYLQFDQRGAFSPIANDTDVTGVMTIKDILRRFRLPLTVKLVQGVWPKVDQNKFTGIVRLNWAYTDETAFVCPLDKGHFRITPVPTEVPLKLLTAKNNPEIAQSQAYQNIITKCNRMIANYNNTIHLILAVPESAINRSKHHSMVNALSAKSPNTENSQSRIKRSRSREDMLMDQVDDLYQYLRDGRPPPQHKFVHDSDEESFFEEPAYEHLDDFRSRLDMLERGQPGHTNSKYKLADLSKVDLRRDNNNSPPTEEKQSGIQTNGKPRTPPQSDTPPPVPPRRYVRTDSAPVIRVPANLQQDSSSGSSKGSGRLPRNVSESTLIAQRRVSKDSNASSGNKKSKDKSTKQQDNRSSTTGSSGKRPSVHTLYL